MATIPSSHRDLLEQPVTTILSTVGADLATLQLPTDNGVLITLRPTHVVAL